MSGFRIPKISVWISNEIVSNIGGNQSKFIFEKGHRMQGRQFDLQLPYFESGNKQPFTRQKKTCCSYTQDASKQSSPRKYEMTLHWRSNGARIRSDGQNFYDLQRRSLIGLTNLDYQAAHPFDADYQNLAKFASQPIYTTILCKGSHPFKTKWYFVRKKFIKC